MSKVLRYDAQGRAIWVDRSEARAIPAAAPPGVLSNSLGCTHHQVDELRADAKLSGYSVEFVPDKSVPGFFQAKCTSAEFERYAKHRGFENKTSRNGAGGIIDEQELRDAKSRILTKYGPARIKRDRHKHTTRAAE